MTYPASFWFRVPTTGLVVLAEGGTVREEDLPGSLRGDAPPPTGATTPAPGPDGTLALPPGGLDLAAQERAFLQQALERCDGNRAAAARMLRMPYRAFLYRAGKYGLDG